MLRSPVERVVSEYKYALARPHKNKGSLQFLQTADGGFAKLMRSLKHNMTLAEYVDFPFKSAQFGSINNRQVSLLAGEEHAHERGEFQLRFALRSLQLFDFVGLTEDFGASLRSWAVRGARTSTAAVRAPGTARSARRRCGASWRRRMHWISSCTT